MRLCTLSKITGTFSLWIFNTKWICPLFRKPRNLDFLFSNLIAFMEKWKKEKFYLEIVLKPLGTLIENLTFFDQCFYRKIFFPPVSCYINILFVGLIVFFYYFESCRCFQKISNWEDGYIWHKNMNILKFHVAFPRHPINWSFTVVIDKKCKVKMTLNFSSDYVFMFDAIRLFTFLFF